MQKKFSIIFFVSLTLFLTASPAAANADGEYHLNETTGSTVYDFSGNNNDATLYGTPASRGVNCISKDTGDWGGGLCYNMSNSDNYITTPIDLSGSESFTVMTHAKIENFTNNQREAIISDNAAQYFSIGENNGRFFARLWDGSSYQEIIGRTVPENEWIHIALVYNESNSSASFYWNGTRNGTVSVDSGSGYNGKYQFFATKNGTDAKDGDGLYDEPKVFKGQVLNQTEIQNYWKYNRDTSGSSPAGPASLTVSQPSTRTYLDQRILLKASTNDTANIKYNFDGGSNLTACNSCQSFYDNITSFDGLSEGQYKLNVWSVTEANQAKKSVTFDYKSGVVEIPEYPYNASFNVMMNFHDDSTCRPETEFTEVNNTIQNLNNYMNVPKNENRTWDSFRMSMMEMPLYQSDDGFKCWMNSSKHNADKLNNEIDTYSFYNSNGPIEYGYHPTRESKNTGIGAGQPVLNSTGYSRILNSFDAYNSMANQDPRSAVHGYYQIDGPVLNTYASRGLLVDFTQVMIRDGVAELQRNDTYFMEDYDITDYTTADEGFSNGKLVKPTDDYFNRKDLANVRLPSSYPSNDYFNEDKGYTASEVKNVIKNQYQKGFSVWSGHGHVGLPNETGNGDRYDQQLVENVSKWFYDRYVSNESVSARFSTASGLGYQKLGHSSAVAILKKNTSSEVVYNITSPERVHWTSVGILDSSNRSTTGATYKVSYDNGNTWEDLRVWKQKNGYDWIEIHLSTALVRSVEDTDATPPTTSDNWTSGQYESQSEVLVELTASDSASSVANITYSVDGGAETTATGNTTSFTVSGDGNHSVTYYAFDSAGNKEAVQTEHVALDTQAPTLSSNASDGWKKKSSEPVGITASDSLSGPSQTSYRVDGGGWTTNNGGSATANVSADGNHTIEFNSTDGAGNTASIVTDYSALDTEKPSTALNDTATGWLSQISKALSADATDSYSGTARISYRVNGGSWTTATGASTDFTVSGDANHTQYLTKHAS